MKEITRIRRSVATLANRLNKKLKNLSESFRQAWAIVRKSLLSKALSATTQRGSANVKNLNFV